MTETEREQNIGNQWVGVSISSPLSPAFRCILPATADVPALAEQLKAELNAAVARAFGDVEWSLAETLGVETTVQVIRPLAVVQAERAERDARLEARYAAARAEWEQYLDTHPDNGRRGAWLVGNYRDEVLVQDVDNARAALRLADLHSVDTVEFHAARLPQVVRT